MRAAAEHSFTGERGRLSALTCISLPDKPTVFSFETPPHPPSLPSASATQFTDLHHRSMPCSASSALALPIRDARRPRARPLSSSTLRPTAGTGEPGPLMSSTIDRLPPLGTAAHLPPGGLIAVAWSGVVLAGAFGECVFGASARRSGA